ncbi:carbamoyltransferase family protein [Chitinophaga sp.]|uniref:carbamoyltransferase family protein n=1 Tax=Chitinophaga sp. TaxID=1869181 RepID=UPI002F9260D2
MNVLGISALYHDAACCLLRDGKIVAAAQEERFTKQKADPSMPVNAMNYCLREAGMSLLDIDAVAYYEDPAKKLSRQLWSGYDYLNSPLRAQLDPRRPEAEIRKLLGYTGEIKMYEHHLSHAASSYYFSGFNESATLTVDGVGEWATTTYGYAEKNALQLFEEVDFPDSIGLLYAAITSFLGFKVNGGEYKVMGLAPYGAPVYVSKLRKLIHTVEGGGYHLDMKYFDFISGNRMYSDELISLLGEQPRKPESDIQKKHTDLAKSLQVVLEEVLIEKARYLHTRTNSDNLCMAGGVALNCVANAKILQHTPFRHLYVQPAANDAGCALGAAALAYMDLTGHTGKVAPMEHVYYGPAYSNREIGKLLAATTLNYDVYDNQEALLQDAAAALANGKVIGWFQGRMEFGPRSLGARSILADPRDGEMRNRINAMVKKREMFRPFAPSVLEEKAAAHFDLDHASPFMLEVCPVISTLDLPAITHVDRSARVQTVSDITNPLYAALIREFDKLTGCPLVLNTSFNVRGQPIVNTPEDAIICFLMSGIDSLVIGDIIIKKENNDIVLLEYMLQNYDQFKKSDVATDVYTFI